MSLKYVKNLITINAAFNDSRNLRMVKFWWNGNDKDYFPIEEALLDCKKTPTLYYQTRNWYILFKKTF